MQRYATRQRVERRLPVLARLALLAIVTGGAASTLLGAPTASAVTARPSFIAADADVRSDGISLDEAIDRAQKRYRARVVRAEQSQSGGRVVYVLRLLSDEDGRVFTVRVDAQTGAIQ